MRKYIALALVVFFAAAIVAPLLAQEAVDVNTASAIQLQALYRVGPKTAAKIIAERDANGPFSSLSDLASRVKGIGPKTIAKWAGKAVCTQPESK
jgi:competence protein ComEA